MQEHNLKKHIESLFKDTKFSDENNNLFTNTILEAIEKIDNDFVEILLKDEKAKKHFFSKVLDTFVMNQFKLIDFFSMNNYFEESYTSYTNKIGLIRKDDFIKKNNDVVLAFPYKDCVLEGGQTKDDQKGKENFFNEVLDSDEIDRLFEPKVLTNIKRYSKDGVEENPTISDKDNLILKGNNLLALHSLKKKYAGRIKLIYIDPPYNTGNDSFKYNDNFNHSTWLTFMKNRLEVAREFLRDDGAIFISIDNNELAEVMCLMSEMFGKENFANLVSVKRGSVTGHKAINPGVVNINEYLLSYSKDKLKWNYNRVYQPRDRNERYNNFIVNRNKDVKEWEFTSLLDAFSDYKKIPKNSLRKKLGSAYDKDIYDFVKSNANAVIQLAYPDIDKVSKDVKELIKQSKKTEDIYWHKREKEKDIFLYKGNRILFYSDRLQNIDGKIETVEPLSDIWLDVLPNDLHTEGGVSLKKGKKPEKLLKRVLEIGSNKNDIVLDFHLGSGTTSAVAHKMGRQYIGIEQMDYIQDITVERMKKVIDGEQGGISKSVNWQDGGEFVYAELKQVSNFDNADKKLKQEMRYLPIGELEDEDYNISKEEIAINKAFYGVDDE
ncbi:site-specific DNA-methyltransferase [Francisellaceae bacterium CB300]